MESSSDADSAAATAARLLFAFSILLFSCYKTQSTKVEALQFIKKSNEVAQLIPTPVSKKKTKKKKLYITFDDGPNKGTANVLQIIQDEGIPVSFFVVGEHVFASSGQRQIWDSLLAAQQIDLCNHSYSHAHNRYDQYYRNPDSVVKDFIRTHERLGLTNTVCRTPGRNIWRIDSLNATDLKKSAAAADSLQKAGFVIMGWDLEWHYDHKSMSVTAPADRLIKNIDSAFAHNKTKMPDHLVLLAHDQVYNKSIDSFQLRQFLQLLKQKDEYEFSLATAYPGAGKVSSADSLNMKAPH